LRKHGVNVTLETKTIAIVLNGEPRRVPEGLNIVALLKFLEIDGQRVAVELNRAIVRKPEWESAEVLEGAEIEVVWFVGGGSMRVIQDTKQQIIERLNDVPADKLHSVLEYVAFVAMDPVARSLLACHVDEEPLRDDALEVIHEALNEPRPGIPDEQIRQELGL
jgi:sulfur carrier protein